MMEEIAIVGSGMAGLTAAYYLCQAGKSPLVIEGYLGSALSRAALVENFPAFEPAPGRDIVAKLREQAANAGARFIEDAVTKVTNGKGLFQLQLAETIVESKAVIWCAGAQASRLALPEEPKYFGRGVSVCATCDGNFFRNKTVAVLAGSPRAKAEAAHLCGLCKTVHFITSDETVPEELGAFQNLIQHCSTKISALKGELRLQAVTLENAITNAREDLEVQGLFVAIGTLPETKALIGLNITDTKGQVILQHPHCTTRLPGFLAAGDCTDSPYRQAVTAAAQGCTAALDALLFLRK